MVEGSGIGKKIVPLVMTPQFPADAFVLMDAGVTQARIPAPQVATKFTQGSAVTVMACACAIGTWVSVKATAPLPKTGPPMLPCPLPAGPAS
jgi:hypothetical protein